MIALYVLLRFNGLEGKLLVIYLRKVYGECQQKIIMHHMQNNEEERKG